MREKIYKPDDIEDISISKAQGELELREAYIHYLRPMKPLKISKSKAYYGRGTTVLYCSSQLRYLNSA